MRNTEVGMRTAAPFYSDFTTLTTIDLVGHNTGWHELLPVGKLYTGKSKPQLETETTLIIHDTEKDQIA